MKKLSLSDRILSALNDHGTMAVGEIASRIRHDPTKTRWLLTSLVDGRKIEKAGIRNSETAYRLLEPGRVQAEQLEGTPENLDEPAPSIASELVAHQAKSTPQPNISAPVFPKEKSSRPSRPAATKPTPQPDPIFTAPQATVGVLTTGEACIVLNAAQIIVISRAQTDALAQMLAARMSA